MDSEWDSDLPWRSEFWEHSGKLSEAVQYSDINLFKGDGILVFILAPGAFIALGYLIALINRIKRT